MSFSTPAALAAASEPLRASQVLQVVAGLSIVLALIAAASWAARRVQGLRPRGEGHIRVIEGLAVGTREKLVLVEIDEQRVLIGMSPGRMQALASFPASAGEHSFSAALAATDPVESS